MSIRVLHVLEAAGFGTGQHLVDLVTHVPDVEHHAVVPAVRHRAGEQRLPTVADRLSNAGATLHEMDIRRNPAHPATLRATATTAAMAGRLRPDVVHGHSSVGGAIARIVGRRHGIPVVYTPHGLAPSAGLLGAERVLARWTAHVIAVSPGERDQIVTAGLAPSGRVSVILHPIDLETPVPQRPGIRELFALTPEAPLVGFVGRLGREKGADVLVRATPMLAERIHDLHVVMIAVGADPVGFDRWTASLGLGGRVHRLPGVPRAAALLSELDVLAVPSRREAGPPYALLEAMRARVPVVAADVIGLRDAVDDGIDGLLVPPDDPAALSATLERVLGDPSLARSLSDGALRRLQQRHDPETFRRAHLTVYEAVSGAAG